MLLLCVFSPFIFLFALHMLYISTEGDCEVLSSVLSGAGIRSIVDEPLLVNILPLHRALSGFHFHGNQKLLIKTCATLLKFGADINAVDSSGNTVLHKAIQVFFLFHIMPPS